MIAAHARNLDLLHDVAPFVSPYPYFMDRIEKSKDKKEQEIIVIFTTGTERMQRIEEERKAPSVTFSPLLFSGNYL